MHTKGTLKFLCEYYTEIKNRYPPKHWSRDFQYIFNYCSCMVGKLIGDHNGIGCLAYISIARSFL